MQCSTTCASVSEDTATTPRVRPLCHCLGVYADEVRQSIADGQLTNVRQVTKACGAGGGCTACHRHIKRMLAESAVEAVTPAFGFA